MAQRKGQGRLFEGVYLLGIFPCEDLNQQLHQVNRYRPIAVIAVPQHLFFLFLALGGPCRR
ncbi:MAG: hypothetical protein AMJ79_01410 [Phycisphaerae bacterium SM23_30]|nr:MAG: hypothetical protein AMJ79_01410 [Phycisphaerae bacterium SM23_30]